MYVFAKSHGSGTAPPTPGKLNLKIAGFSRQSIVSISQIVQAIDLLPAFHLEGLREIVYAPDWNPTLTPDPYSPRPPCHVKGREGSSFSTSTVQTFFTRCCITRSAISCFSWRSTAT
jgi:hypothetical protein